MGWLYVLGRFVRDLPIGFKLAMTVVGALSLLIGVSWFAYDSLGFVTGMQRGAAAHATVERQVQRGLIAAQELPVIARDVQGQQSVAGIRAALDRAGKQTETATGLLHEVNAGPDQPLLEAALSSLDRLMGAVKQAAALRTELLAARQRRLFQARPVFETAMTTLMNELARGGAVESGVDSVRADGASARADLHDPTIEAANRYRLAMSRVQAAAMMFMATGAKSAANDIRDATAEATASMQAVLSGPAPGSVKQDARMVETIGAGIATAATDLVAMSGQLDQVAGAEVEAASQAMRTSFEKLAETAADHGRTASDSALAAGIESSNHILIMVGVITVLMVTLGSAITWMLSGPIRSLTRSVQLIAGGKTDEAVPYTTWHDEIGHMAAAVETLRGVMRQTFIQAQMIEQLPVGVMTAESKGDFRITYVNAEAKRIVDLVKDTLTVPVDSLVGQPIGVFHPNAGRQRELMGNPANLPHRTRISLGTETIDLQISAIFDRDGVYAGPLLIWHQATAQVRLVRQFEESVGTIARIVADSAEGMCEVASAMRESAIAAGQRTLAVSAASDQASASVSTAAAGAEEVSASVAEIGRRVSESAEIAARAVSEAQATDASVSQLSEAAERISAVVRLISDIAARTNLLALNATIEAARAGEAGKGFAVVAGEVKTLATQTAKATREIGGQIAAMQSATGQAVTALRSISGTIQRMNEIAIVIAGSVDAQGAATASIAQAVQNAAAGTAEVNSNIAAVTAVVEETGSRAGGVLAAATGVTGQAATLKDEVAKFLLAVQQAA
jgi:methyl-accepting chemotaxis protein